jgi:hypothetical protein
MRKVLAYCLFLIVIISTSSTGQQDIGNGIFQVVGKICQISTGIYLEPTIGHIFVQNEAGTSVVHAWFNMTTPEGKCLLAHAMKLYDTRDLVWVNFRRNTGAKYLTPTYATTDVLVGIGTNTTY